MDNQVNVCSTGFQKNSYIDRPAYVEGYPNSETNKDNPSQSDLVGYAVVGYSKVH